MRIKIKNILLFFIFFITLIYLSFLFVLPKFLNLQKYSSLVEDTFFKQTGYSVHLYNPTLSTTYNLNVKFGVERADVFSDKQKFAQVNDLKINLALIPIIFKTIKITDIKASKVIVEVPKNFILPEYQHSKYNIFKKLPDVSFDYCRFTFKNSGNNYSLKLNNFYFSDNPLLNKMKISSKGEIFTNKNKNIDLDLYLLFKPIEQNFKKFDINNFLIFLKTYDLKANIDIKADISDFSEIKGLVKISNISFLSKGKRNKKSFINLSFDKNKIKTNSSIYTSQNDKIDVDGFFNYGNKKLLDLSVKSDYIAIQDLIVMLKSFLKSTNYIDDLYVNGYLKSDFKLKTDFNKLYSDGNMFIKNMNIAYKGYTLSDMNSNIDFSKNRIEFLNTSAKIFNNPLNIKGAIDNNAFANITIESNHLKLNNLIDKKYLKENDIEGNVDFKASLVGSLKNINTTANILVSKVKIKNKQSGFITKNDETKINLKDKNIFLTINNTLITNNNGLNSILIPNLKAKLVDNKLEIDKTFLWIDNIKAEILGNIVDIYNIPTFNNLKINIPSQTNVSGFLNSKISINGDLTMNGTIKSPKLVGNINIPKFSIPTDSINIQNIIISADNIIKINCPYISIKDSIFRMNVQIDNILKPELKNLNIYSDYIDLNKIKPLAKKYPLLIPIDKGVFRANKVKINEILADNIVSDISDKNNIIILKNLRGEAFSGKIAADINYYINQDKTQMKLQGRGLEANRALEAVSSQKQDIQGKCDFDSNISFVGTKPIQIQKTLKGDLKFIVNNFVSDNLGKLEYLIQAQNIISNKQISLKDIRNTLMIKDSGVYKDAKGEIHFNDGYAYIKNIKLAGPSMSLYMNGRLYMPDNTVFLLILGKVSEDIVNSLGNIGQTSLGNTKNVGSIASAYLTDVTTFSDIKDISKVPELTVKTNFKTRNFKVLINGDINKQSSVETFKWINSDGIKPTVKKHEVPDFIKKLPEYN